ncbi:MAG: AAA family ATPase [Deltaproteobacteria bacterium]|nr:AAA family ATPase [Deltaproteobacteria bacterium]
MSSFRIELANFRALKRLDWSPEGVCLLSGANGAGKTSAFDALLFLRTLFTMGHEAAFGLVGAAALKHIGSEPEEPVELRLTVGELRWVVRLPMSAQGLKGAIGEELYWGENIMLRAGMFQEYWFIGEPGDLGGGGRGSSLFDRDERRACAKVVWDRGSYPWMAPLANFLEDVRIYDSYSMSLVAEPQPNVAPSSVLHSSGKNLWAVLAAWKSSPIRFNGQYEWVLAEARKAFPGLLESIEFERGLPYLYGRGAKSVEDSYPPSRAASGLLTGLLHLTAVAGAKPGSLLTFDEMENQLHPHAIRSILAAMRTQAEERGLTILLSTHSPVLLNQFRDVPEQVFVLGHGRDDKPTPAPLTALFDEDWLAHSDLGVLYEQLAFSSPILPRGAR